MNNGRFEVVYAGGTISSFADAEGVRFGGKAVNVVSLLESQAGAPDPHLILGNKAIAYTGLSENMMPQDWEVIDAKIDEALERNPRSVIVTHGTDSMEQTGLHLREKYLARLQELETSIILTGATDDIEHPETDAWDNLRFTFESANDGSTVPDVYIAFRDRLVRADEAIKIPYVVGGELGYVSVNDPDYARVLSVQREQVAKQIRELENIYHKHPDPTQAIVYDVNTIRENHQAFIDQLAAAGNRPRAILLNLYHSGTANTDKPEQSVAELVKKLRRDHGVIFFGATENGEAVNLRAYETSIKLRDAGVVPLYNMHKDVALAKLQLIDAGADPADVIDEMLRDNCGEIDQSQIDTGDIDKLKVLYSR